MFPHLLGSRPILRRVALILLASSLTLGGCAGRGGGGRSEAVPVTVAPLRYLSIASSVEVSGSLSAVESATVAAATAGRVVEVPVRRARSVLRARDFEIDAVAPDEVLASVQPGEPVTVRVDALGGASIPGRVRAIVPSRRVELHSGMVEIVVMRDPRLMPGMFARVTLSDQARHVWVAPASAVAMRGGRSGVFEIRKGVALFFALHTGVASGHSVELIGIDGSGMRVATSNLERLENGTRVTESR